MKFSSLVLLAISALAAPSPMTQNLQPVSQDDLNTLNNLLSSVLNSTNPILKQKLIDGKMDPLEKVFEGAIAKSKDIKICTTLVGAHYGIENLTGLSDVKIAELKVTSAEADEDGTLVLDIAGSINKINMSADVDGVISAQCGKISPKSYIRGTVFADEVTISIIAQASAVVTDSWTINQLDIKSISADFEDVLVHFNHFGQIFNPLLDTILKAVEHTFKAKIEEVIDESLKSNVQNLIKSKLPLVIKV